jgi:hypothetical protein
MLQNMKVKRQLIILVMVMTMNLSNALATDDPGDPSANDPAVPVDGGISLLLAAGAGLAAKKLLAQRRQVKYPPDSGE